MKIQGPNHAKINPYQKQLQKQTNIKKDTNKSDQLQISDAAKHLQESNKLVETRQERVEQIKQAVDNGEYQVDPQKTAKKMIDFWSNQV